MKVTLEKLLYTMIKSWEVDERFRRDDFTFDAFNYLAKQMGHKNSSTLRKMCGPQSSRCGAKLGVEDAMILMTEMNDYRLIDFIREELKSRKLENEQLNLIFNQPNRQL
jgi:hypothetical protein